MTTAVASSELYLLLRDAGLVPDQCQTVIIELPLGGAVTIHTKSFPDGRILDVIGAFIQQYPRGENPEASLKDRDMADHASEASCD
jgi:hypothetical protein